MRPWIGRIRGCVGDAGTDREVANEAVPPSPNALERNTAINVASCACQRCVADRSYLTLARRPVAKRKRPEIRIVDLFSGCGGMSIGLLEGLSRARINGVVRLAVDSDDAVLKILTRNIPEAVVGDAAVEKLFDGPLGGALTRTEIRMRRQVGRIEVLMGGPPCQGHSDLNNHTRRNDPKNALYLRMARAAEVLRPKIVIIENVPPVKWDRLGVVQRTTQALRKAQYNVADRVIDLLRIGVPQRRRRHVLVASRVMCVAPEHLLSKIDLPLTLHAPRTVAWAISDLMSQHGTSLFDSSSKMTAENQQRARFLLDRDLYDLPDALRPPCHREQVHSYKSMYGRLRWDRPAQTITTGFGSMGQGRFIHPADARTLTPHEAARLQTFPDWFDFGVGARGVVTKAIGNAVPPLLTVALGTLIGPALAASQDNRR